MASSEVAIVNRALQKLGAKTISSLTQDHPNARAMNRAYVPIRDALLRKYQWNFCVKRAQLAADTTGELYEGLTRYKLPTDYMRLLRETRTSFYREVRRDWQIEAGHIVTSDGAPLNIRYLATVTDTAQFDALFDELLAAKLALETVHAVTGSNVKKQDLRLDVREALADARQANSFENDSENPVEDDWIALMR